MARLQRQAVVAVPPEHEPRAHSHDLTALTDQLTASVARAMFRETGRVLSLAEAVWIIACSKDPDRVDLVPSADDCPEAGCPVCLAGKDQARAYMAEHPGRHVAIGRVTFEL